MKQILLLFVLFLSTATITIAQGEYACNNCGSKTVKSYKATPPNHSNVDFQRKKINLKIYPNPAIDFIGVNNDIETGELVIYNLIGRQMERYQMEKEKKYDVTGLPKGMYLVQLISTGGKVLGTKRMSKK